MKMLTTGDEPTGPTDNINSVEMQEPQKDKVAAVKKAEGGEDSEFQNKHQFRLFVGVVLAGQAVSLMPFGAVSDRE